MGEIADAIRRARGQDAPAPLAGKGREAPESADEREDGEYALPRLRDILPPAEAAPEPEIVSSQARWIESVEPNNPIAIPQEGPHAELCRHVALRLRDVMEARHARSVAVVSAERGDGKTTVACNLAAALASLSRGRDVALVDLDLRKPSLVRYLNLQPGPGIEEVLLDRAKLEDVKISLGEPAIDVYPAVTPQRAGHGLMVLPKLAEIVKRLERSYATVIFDTPPTPVVPDANLLLRHVPCCVPVARRGKTRARSLRRLLAGVQSRQIAGWVLNCDRSSEVRDHDYYYYGEREEEPR